MSGEANSHRRFVEWSTWPRSCSEHGGLEETVSKMQTGRDRATKVATVLVPRLRLGTYISRALPANCLYFIIIVEAEPRARHSQAEPGTRKNMADWKVRPTIATRDVNQVSLPSERFRFF